MARPVPRRRGASAPAADDYTPRGRGRSAEPDEDADTERRPRRGRERGELPSRGRRSAEHTSDSLEALSDDDLFDLAEKLGIPEEVDDPADIIDAILEQQRQPADEDEPPARGRRGRSSEPDEDEPPARSRRGRGRASEDEDEKPSRGRGRGRSKDDDEDEPPARGRGRGRSRSRDDDEDEDGEERSTRKASRGFDAFKKAKQTYGGFDDDFKLTEDEVLVKFLEDEPFAVYGEHGLYDELREGQRVWNCLKPDEPCAICSTGHKPRPIALWNIVVIPEEGEPELKVLKAGPKLEGIIEKKAALKTGPMSKEYYSLSQTDPKAKGPVDYAVEVVRERDLKDDWDTDPLTDEELDTFDEQKHDEGFVKYPTVSQVKDVARKMRDAD